MEPKPPGQQPCQRSQQRTVGLGRSRTGDLTAQDRDLVPQNQDLNVFRRVVRARSANQPNNRTIN
jgi:hypothetical protein